MNNHYSKEKNFSVDRLWTWRNALEFMWGKFDIICDARNDFYGDVIDCSVGYLKLIEIASFSKSLVCVPKSDSIDSSDVVFLVKQVSGQTNIKHNNRSICLNTGDITLINSHIHTVYSFKNNATIKIIMLPRRALINKFNGREVVYFSNLGRGTGLGVILSSFVNSLFEYHSKLYLEEAETIIDTILSLLPDLTHRQLKHKKEVSLSPINSALLTQINQYIDFHISDPTLGPDAIASYCGISVRHLHRVFSETDITVTQWVRRLRLEKCAKDLKNYEFRNLSITEIALRWGFNDSSYFSRVFKIVSGMTPKQYRSSQKHTQGPGQIIWSDKNIMPCTTNENIVSLN